MTRVSPAESENSRSFAPPTCPECPSDRLAEAGESRPGLTPIAHSGPSLHPRDAAMFDPLDRLVQDDHLFRLLQHYVEAGDNDRDAWHSRAADSSPDGISDEIQVRDHGELLGAAWIEINL